MKCNNCGAEVAEGMKFCCDCGSPLPQEKKCINCGATIALKMKFCPECGAPQDAAASKPKFNAAAFAMGDKNVIAGDVIGSQETTHIAGNATIIKNEDQSKQVKRCHICGSLVLITEGFDCPECGEFTCGKCYDADKNCCNDCVEKQAKSKETQYEAALKAALADGKIDLEERRTLNDLASKLGLSAQQASQIEKALKGEDTAGSMTTAEQLELDSARKQFYACEGDLSSILATAQKIYTSYPTNEKALALYLPVLAASGKTDEALRVINALGADVLSAYITALDICLTTENMSEAERYLKKAAMLWPESNTLKCYQVYYYLKMYHKYNDFSFLEKATAANAALKNVSGELELSHQIRVMSLLQKEAGEELPPYDRDFCKDNSLYFRVVSNVNLTGVYMEGGCANAVGSTRDEVEPFMFDGMYDIKFYVKADAVPGSDGRYDEYIVVANDDFIITPECGNSEFDGVYAMNLPDPDDDDYEDRLDDENMKLYREYVVPYIENGKQVSIKKITFEGENDNDNDPEGLPGFNYELRFRLQAVQDDSEDAYDGIHLYRIDQINKLQVQVRMLDYGKNKAEEDKVLEKLAVSLNELYSGCNASFTYNGCGGIISKLFVTNIQHNLENFLDSFSDSGHKYFVTAINTNLDDPLTWRICNGEVEFDSSTDYVDAWGNFCELDTTTVHVYYVWDDESEESDYIYAMPVKRMLEQKDFSFDPDDNMKVPAFFEKHYQEEDLLEEGVSVDAFSDYLRSSTLGNPYEENDGGYLLDKDGKKIFSLKDFDHTNPDEDGWVYYPVPASDFVDKDPYNKLTPEAQEKWRKKLGL